MSIDLLNLGSAPDDGTGQDLRSGGQVINDNFAELDTRTASAQAAADAAERVLVAGANIQIDRTDPDHPVISASGGSAGTVQTVAGVTPDVVGDIPVVELSSALGLDNKVDKVAGKGLSSNDFTSTEKTKLAGVADNATANATNAQLRDRSTHTGTQLAATISDLSAAVRAVTVSGLVLADAAITSADSILVALGKAQGQINARTPIATNVDTTAGRLLTVGAFGWSGGTAISQPNTTDADTLLVSAVHAFGNGGINLPTNSAAYYLRVTKHGSLYLQEAFGMTAGLNGKNYTRTHNGTAWQAWAPMGGGSGSGLPVGSLVPWHLPEASLPSGHIPVNGQLVTRAMWPELWALYAPYVVTDAFWIANPLSRGKPSSGDGSTTFRMPDMNGKYSDGLTPAAFLRGYGLNSAGTPGLMQRDQLGPMLWADSTFNSLTSVYLSNAAVSTTTAVMPRGATTQLPPVSSAPDGAKWVTNTGSETRAFSSTVIWCCIGGTTAVNPGTVDITATAAQVTAQGSRIANLEAAGSLGVGQTWQTLTASRALGTTYTNSTGRTVFAHVDYNINVGVARAAITIVNAVTGTTVTLTGTSIGGSGLCTHISAPIPSGASYTVTNIGGGTVSAFSWAELR